ncbi:MAG: hypothetical protein Q8942_01105 [Bacillota bacterium]|nr:hypothetical protein [Bacillota bacterium]
MSEDRKQKVNDSLNKILSSKEFQAHKNGKTFLEKISDVIQNILDKIRELLDRINPPEPNLPIKPRGISSGASVVFQFFCILLLLAIVVVGAYFLLRKLRSERKIKENEDSELLVMLKDPDSVMQQVMEFYSKGDFRQGLRYLYLALLLKLNEQEFIKIDKAKTNKQYLNELYKNEYINYNRVNEFTRIFNKCWYGNRNIDKEKFDRWHKEYSSIIGEAQA